jgi:steroid 5-alpha reductase family enzyme
LAGSSPTFGQSFVDDGSNRRARTSVEPSPRTDSEPSSRTAVRIFVGNTVPLVVLCSARRTYSTSGSTILDFFLLQDAISLVLIAWLAATLLMLVLWAWHQRLRNAAVVDVGRAAGLAIAALVDGVAGDGHPIRRWLVALMMAIWGTRLAISLLITRVVGKPGSPPRAVESRGAEHREYQRTTSVFVPWVRRS